MEVRRKLKDKIEGRRQSENLSDSAVSGELQRNRPYQLRPGELEKRQMRSQRNRLSATQSRLRREEKLRQLEMTVQQKENENKSIERTISELNKELNALQSLLDEHKPYCKRQHALPSLKQEIDNNHPGSRMHTTDHVSNFSQSFSTVDTEQMDIVDNDVISLKPMKCSLYEPSLATMDEDDQSQLEAIINTLCSNPVGNTRQYLPMPSGGEDCQHYKLCQYTCATPADTLDIHKPTPQMNYTKSGLQLSRNNFSTETETTLPNFQEPVSRTNWRQHANAINDITTCHMSGTDSTAEALPFHKRETKVLGSHRRSEDLSTETSTNVRRKTFLTRMLDYDIKNTKPSVHTPRFSEQIGTTATCTMPPRDKKDNIYCVTNIPVNDPHMSDCDKKVLLTSSHGSMSELVPTISFSKQIHGSDANLLPTPCTAPTFTKSNIYELLLALSPVEAVEAIESFLRDDTKTDPETYYLRYISRI